MSVPGPEPMSAHDGDPEVEPTRSSFAVPRRSRAGNVRPPAIAVAACLAFLNALLLLFPALTYLAASTVARAGDVAVLLVFGFLYLVPGVGNLVGGVLALRGRRRQLVIVAAAAAAVLGLAVLIIALVSGVGFNLYWLVLVLVGCLTIALVMRPRSREFFDADGRP